MPNSHEENWPTATSPRYLLKLSRVRSSGRQYTLLACAAVRHLIPGPRTELGTLILDAIERFAFAQPRKGVQTHVWNEVRRVLPEVPDVGPFTWAGTNAAWVAEFTHRLGSLSQVCAADINVIFDVAFRQTAAHIRRTAVAEVSKLLSRLSRVTGPKSPPRMTVAEVRDELASRVAPVRRAAFLARWAEVADDETARRAAFTFTNERFEVQMAEANAKACELVREVFGNPFRPAVIEPHWLTWNHGAVRHIAERIATTNDFTDLPVLSDALEDAGCCDEALLAHCREVNTHVPGCWALDAVLGR